MAWLTLLPLPIGSAEIEAARALATYDHNAVPFATLTTQLDGGLTQFELRQVAGNLLLLLPLGVYGPILLRAMRSVVVTAIVAAGVAGAIELAQLALATAYGFPVRVADVDDVLLNTVGALLGFVAWRIWPRGPIESKSDAVRDSPHR